MNNLQYYNPINTYLTGIFPAKYNTNNMNQYTYNDTIVSLTYDDIGLPIGFLKVEKKRKEESEATSPNVLQCVNKITL